MYWRTKKPGEYVIDLNVPWLYKTVLPVEVYMYIEIKYIKSDKTKKEDRVNGVTDFLSPCLSGKWKKLII